MFSTSQIVAASSRKAFDRGYALMGNANLLRRRGFRELGADCEVFAEVRSSSGIADCFHCYLDLTSDCDEIIEGGCDCPASRKQHGMCKHCVALALSFKESPASFEGYSDRLSPRTSRSVRAYLDRAPDIDAREAAAGSIHLHAQLINDFDLWSLRLKVSDDRVSYVVSDIDGFARALRGHLYMKYGKRLGFVHSLDAFAQGASRGLAHLVGEMAPSSAPAKRELRLSEGDVVRVLDALGDAPFEYCDMSLSRDLAASSPTAPSDSSNHAVEMSVVDADPELSIRIMRLASGGYEIMRDADVHVVLNAGAAYAFADGVAYRTSRDFGEAARFLRDVYQSVDDELHISDDDIAEFCKKVLPGIEGALDIEEPPELEALKPVAASFSFYLDCERRGRGKAELITVDARVRYRDSECVVGEFDKDDVVFRDERAEAAVAHVVAELFGEEGCIPLSDEEAAGTLLYGGLSELQRIGEVFTTPAFDRLFNDRSLRVQIGLSVSGNLIDMDVHATDVSAEELAQILRSVQRKKRFHRLKSGAIASLEDADVEALARLSVDFGIKPADIEAGRVEIPVYHAFFLDREYSDAVRNEEFEAYIDRFDGDSLYDFEPPAHLAGILRPYQVDGYKWLRKLSAIGFGGILADEMGLGKSLQAIAYLSDMFAAGEAQDAALVVSPASLVYNWAEEFAKFAPEMKVAIVDGPRSERARKRAMDGVQVFIASYDAVRMDIDAIQDISYSVAVLDEAQYIKNQATKTSRAVRRIKACHRFALTGTPVENRLSEVWSIFDFLMPGFLGSYMQFKRRFEVDVLGGDEDAARRLKSLIGPFVLRRLKEDVLADLPDKQESVVVVPLEGEQARLYLAQEQSLRESLLEARRARKAARGSRLGHDVASDGEAGVKVDVLAELMRLRQVALDPSLAYDGFSGVAAKTGAIMELVEQSIVSGRKSLVFSQFTSYLDILKSVLDERSIRYYEITGATDKRQRVSMVNSFNSDDVPVFLVSLKAGGTGLNLIGASVVIHADPWWNAAAIDQATDRAHRIGQKSMVSVYKVIAKGTIEERILKLQESKRKLARSVIGETSLSSLASMTRADLESLLLD